MLPELFLERMKEMLGEEYPAFLQSLDGENYRALHLNMRKADIDKFQRESPFALRAVPWADGGFYYEESDQPGRHPLHAAGVYYIQEPSAMAPVPFLEARPGERILDLCAAPGGKTIQIADAMKGRGILVSNEMHPARARILSENVERMGVANAIVTNETPERLAGEFPGYFDRILVDAPCSGEGMFRKNDAACAQWSPENVDMCAERQDQILSCAAMMLRPGGRLVYSTCTFAPQEDEGTVSRFLHLHPEFEIRRAERPEGFVGGEGRWTADPAPGIEHTMRLMPHRLQGEGHYLAVLEKKGEQGTPRGSTGGLQSGIPKKEYAEFLAFQREYLNGENREGIFLRFGEQLYLGPADMPSLRGIKTLRCGLHLGTLKKNRFEPSHALALALSPGEARQFIDLSFDSGRAGRYIYGETISARTDGPVRVNRAGMNGQTKSEGEKPAEDPRGWCLVCVDGYSLGWGKITGEVIKNHYPKGLRKG
ncbi:MAG: RNA methyltransferase [Lachnospiraceae bacterium]|nr:RNA methyltransferase [Lachnospiraceae bacterium]